MKPIRPHGGTMPGSTAIHEAQHVAPNPRNIRRASINPGQGFLGFAEPYVFDPIMAAGPHAMGSGGTGHDMRLIELHGHDTGSAASAARSILSNLHEEVHAIASVLQEKGEISGYEAEEIMDEVANPEAEIKVIGPDGKERSFVSKVRKGEKHIITIGLENEKKDKNSGLLNNKEPKKDEKKSSSHPLRDKLNKPINLSDYQNTKRFTAAAV